MNRYGVPCSTGTDSVPLNILLGGGRRPAVFHLNGCITTMPRSQPGSTLLGVLPPPLPPLPRRLPCLPRWVLLLLAAATAPSESTALTTTVSALLAAGALPAAPSRLFRACRGRPFSVADSAEGAVAAGGPALPLAGILTLATAQEPSWGASSCRSSSVSSSLPTRRGAQVPKPGRTFGSTTCRPQMLLGFMMYGFQGLMCRV